MSAGNLRLPNWILFGANAGEDKEATLVDAFVGLFLDRGAIPPLLKLEQKQMFYIYI